MSEKPSFGSRSHSRKISLRTFIGCLIFFAFCASFSSLVIGHRVNRLRYRQQQMMQLHHPQNTPQLNNHNHDQDEMIYDGDFITKILRGDESFPEKNVQFRLKYQPGTLQMSSAESLQHCYVNMTHYRGHFDDLFSIQVSFSERYKLIYRNIPKSSSSSARHAMGNIFDGHDRRLKHSALNYYVKKENYTLVSFVRDPLNRFYSSYDEAYFRFGPWMGDGPIVADKPILQKIYLNNKHKLDPYPYLYKDMHTIGDYRRMYCPEDVLKRNYILCNSVESIDDGSLVHRFEKFVSDYDGRNPFDVHLYLQLAFLVYNARSNFNPLPITKIYN